MTTEGAGWKNPIQDCKDESKINGFASLHAICELYILKQIKAPIICLAKSMSDSFCMDGWITFSVRFNTLSSKPRVINYLPFRKEVLLIANGKLYRPNVRTYPIIS